MRLSLGQAPLALLSVFASLTGVTSAPFRFHPDFDVLVNHAQALLKESKQALHLLKKVSSLEGEHKLESLPVLAASATDMSNIQVKATLSKLLSDLRAYEKHIEWVKATSEKHHHVQLPKMHAVLSRLQNFAGSLEHQIVKLGLVPPKSPSPALPPLNSNTWSVIQASHAILQNLRLFSDWAVRALLALTGKV
ncbi:interleukin-11 [Erpetoichthys calabaricus]|uniref:Interleukin-11 n=1 Tax=Erpetoichthys calabaricus TaxID=27687 RepID=A0A8C4T4R4_ERPCA|nr:interleukin-11 [Erpetoichthys calabaricus]